MPTRKPTSPAKRAANKRNAQKSTGPRTKRGKRKSRRNALKHGLLAKECVIQTGDGRESKPHFDRILEALIREHRPVGLVEEALTERIAQIYWRLRRAQRYEIGALRKNLDELNLPEHLTETTDEDCPASACLSLDKIHEEIDNLRAKRNRLKRLRDAVAAGTVDLTAADTYDTYKPALNRLMANRQLVLPDMDSQDLLNTVAEIKEASKEGPSSAGARALAEHALEESPNTDAQPEDNAPNATAADTPSPSVDPSFAQQGVGDGPDTDAPSTIISPARPPRSISGILNLLQGVPTTEQIAAASRTHHLRFLAAQGLEGETLHRELADALADLILNTQRRLDARQADLRAVEKYHALTRDRRQFTHSLPDDETVSRLIRYENMLDRQLHRAIRELTARQDKRKRRQTAGEKDEN